MKLSGKTAIVTGASRGIGKAIAIALARDGAQVIVAARSEQEGRVPGTIHKTIEEIQALGGRAMAIKTDVASEEEVNAMVQKTLDVCGSVDVLVNNAGVAVPGSIAELTAKRWDLVMAVNVKGTFLCSKAVLPAMMGQKSGSIINLSSVLANRRILKGGVPYGVTKAAIERFTRGLAEEVKEYNIAVNALVADFTKTEGSLIAFAGFDMSSWLEPEVWGKYCVFLASQDARSLTGQCLTLEDLEKLCR
jgi:citronellol/citronellal dehydrogenase